MKNNTTSADAEQTDADLTTAQEKVIEFQKQIEEKEELLRKHKQAFNAAMSSLSDSSDDKKSVFEKDVSDAEGSISAVTTDISHLKIKLQDAEQNVKKLQRKKWLTLSFWTGLFKENLSLVMYGSLAGILLGVCLWIFWPSGSKSATADVVPSGDSTEKVPPGTDPVNPLLPVISDSNESNPSEEVIPDVPPVATAPDPIPLIPDPVAPVLQGKTASVILYWKKGDRIGHKRYVCTKTHQIKNLVFIGSKNSGESYVIVENQKFPLSDQTVSDLLTKVWKTPAREKNIYEITY